MPKISKASKFEQYDSMVSDMYSFLSHIYGVSNGPKLFLEVSSNVLVQNVFYNVWKSDKYVSCVILFVPLECIAAAVFNTPGCMQLFQIVKWGGLSEKLENSHKKKGGTIIIIYVFDKGRYIFLVKFV